MNASVVKGESVLVKFVNGYYKGQIDDKVCLGKLGPVIPVDIRDKL